MNEASEYQDCIREEIELADLRAEWLPFIPKRITRRWLRRTETDAIQCLMKLWLLEWNLESNATSGERYERAEGELRQRQRQNNHETSKNRDTA
jgi:hypothetical protein